MNKLGWVIGLAGLLVGASGAAPVHAQAPSKNVIMAVPANQFMPAVLTIKAGESVTWMNVGGFHNVTADDGSFRCSNDCKPGSTSAPSKNNWTFTLTFDKPGTIQFYCETHGAPGGKGMNGMIIVQPATPSSDGDGEVVTTLASADSASHSAASEVAP
jgi:plastocyanin